MASEREAAKRAITTAREGQDPDLTNALSAAHTLQLELQKENNRHVEEMRAKDLGQIGKWIGGKENAPFVVAIGLLVCGMLIAVGSLIAAANFKDQQEFWSKQAERGFALAAAAGAFLAGKGSKD